MGHLKQALFTFGKAQFSACVATLVDFSLTILLAKLFHVPYVWATFLGAVCGGITNCVINYRWVFHATDQKKRWVAMRYLFVWGMSILLNTFGTYALTELTGIDFIIVKAVVAAVVAVVWNYQMQRVFVFHHPSSLISHLSSLIQK